MTTTTSPSDLQTRAGQRTRPTALLRRRKPSLLAIAATAASLALVAPLPEGLQTSISAWTLLLAAVIYLTWGTYRGDLASRRLLSAQTAAVLAFGAVAIAAVAIDPVAGRYLLAAGWLAHAAWDVAHHRADRVVPRWYSEACLVSDVIVATALVTAASI